MVFDALRSPSLGPLTDAPVFLLTRLETRRSRLREVGEAVAEAD